MSLADLLARPRYRAAWADLSRKVRTLESFSQTEADGGRDIAAAALRVGDEEIRGHLLRHAEDEKRHAEMFRHRAADLRAEHGLAHDEDQDSDKLYDLTRGRPDTELDAHGFYTVGLLDELGEVPYLAMLHVAEQRAEKLFDLHASLIEDDPETQAVFLSILKDEKYHVAYTGRILDKWRKEGRERDVKRALRGARESRFIGAWKRLGLRSGGGLAKVLLIAMYWTVLAPFGLLGSRRTQPSGWREARSVGTVRSQY